MSVMTHGDLPPCSVDELLTPPERDRFNRRVDRNDLGPLWFERPWGQLVVELPDESVGLVLQPSPGLRERLSAKREILVQLAAAGTTVAWLTAVFLVGAPSPWVVDLVVTGVVLGGLAGWFASRWADGERLRAERIELVPSGHLVGLLAGRHGAAEQQVAQQFLNCGATDPRVLDCEEGLQLVRGVSQCRQRARRLGDPDVIAATSLLVQSMVTPAHRQVIAARVSDLRQALAAMEEQHAAAHLACGREDAARLGARLDDAVRPVLRVVPAPDTDGS